MKALLLISGTFAIFILVFFVLLYKTQSHTVTVHYDCRMLIGGWHPDVPVEVQEQCRKHKEN